MLRPTSDSDLPTLRGFFTHPGFYEHWDGYAKPDDEILDKFTGARSPEVECFIIESGGAAVGFVQYHASHDSGGGMDMVLMPEARGRGSGHWSCVATPTFFTPAVAGGR